MSEKAGYRDTLEEVIRAVPERECLKKKDVCRITGWDYRTVMRRIRFNQFGEVTRADLARQICI